jgi:hypothetical protein
LILIAYSGSPRFYQSLLADANNEEDAGDKTRCDPKLTEGTEIVRELPLPSSSETLRDCNDAPMGNTLEPFPFVESSARKTLAAVLAISSVLSR